MFRQIAAPMKVIAQRRRALFEGLAEEVDAADYDGKGLGDPLATSAMAFVAVLLCLGHFSSASKRENITPECLGRE